MVHVCPECGGKLSYGDLDYCWCNACGWSGDCEDLVQPSFLDSSIPVVSPHAP